MRAETSSVISLDTITFADGPGGTVMTYDAELTLKGRGEAARASRCGVGFRASGRRTRRPGLERELAALPVAGE